VADDAFYRPNRQPPRHASRALVSRSGRFARITSPSCELRYHGEWGVEAQCLRDEEFRMADGFR
jgi:hypothetical protein